MFRQKLFKIALYCGLALANAQISHNELVKIIYQNHPKAIANIKKHKGRHKNPETYVYRSDTWQISDDEYNKLPTEYQKKVYTIGKHGNNKGKYVVNNEWRKEIVKIINES